MRIVTDKFLAAADHLSDEHFAYVDLLPAGRPCMTCKIVGGELDDIEVEPWLQTIGQHKTKMAAMDLLENIVRQYVETVAT